MNVLLLLLLALLAQQKEWFTEEAESAGDLLLLLLHSGYTLNTTSKTSYPEVHLDQQHLIQFSCVQSRWSFEAARLLSQLIRGT